MRRNLRARRFVASGQVQVDSAEAPNRSRSAVNSPAESAGSRTASSRIARTSASIDLP